MEGVESVVCVLFGSLLVWCIVSVGILVCDFGLCWPATNHLVTVDI